MALAQRENSTYPVSRKEKLLLVLLLVLVVLAFHELIIGDMASGFMPTVIGAFFSVSGISPQFIYVLVIGLLFIRREDITAAYYGEGQP